MSWCRLLRNIRGCIFRFDGGWSLHLGFRRRCASQFDVHAERNLSIRKVKLHGAAVGFEVGQNFACVVDNSGATFGERALRVADDLCEPRLLVYKAKQCPQNITLHALCGTTALEHRVLMTDPHMKYALVVANESLSKITNYSDRSSCILFGDGAAAAIIEYAPDALYTSHLGADGTGAKYLYAHSALPRSPFVKAKREVECGDPDMQLAPQGWEYTMLQDGREVYRFATHALEKAARLAAEKIGFDLNDLDKVVPHQANMRIIETAMKYLKQPMEKVIVNIDHHGNTSSASIPIALDEGIREGKIQRGDKICLVGFGAGLTYAAIIMEY